MSQYPFAWIGGALFRVCRLCSLPHLSMLFKSKHMSLKNQGILSIGTYNDNSKEYNIDARGKDLAAVMRTIDTEDIQPVEEEKPTNTPSAIPPDFFCVSARFSEENIRERLDAELSLATTKIEYCRALYRLQHIGCINIQQYASDAQRAIVFNRFQSKFNLSPDDFCRARMNK